MTLKLEINRIDVTLKSISADTVSEALEGLEDEISRRLQGAKLPNQGLSCANVSLKPLMLRADPDPQQIRTLLVEQIMTGITQSLDAAGNTGGRL